MIVPISKLANTSSLSLEPALQLDRALSADLVRMSSHLRIWIRPRTERLRCNARRNWGLMPALMQVQSHPDNFNSDVFEAVPPGGCSVVDLFACCGHFE